MLIENINIYKTSRYIQIKSNCENNIKMDDIPFKIKHKYDNFTWLIEIDNIYRDVFIDVNDCLTGLDNNIKCQKHYLNKNNIIIKIKNVKDKIILDTDINILGNIDSDKELIGNLYLDQIWPYNGKYNYKWKLSGLRFKE